MESQAPFKPGDVVILKSGSQPMTVQFCFQANNNGTESGKYWRTDVICEPDPMTPNTNAVRELKSYTLNADALKLRETKK